VSGNWKTSSDCWTLDEQELALLANKSGATRLGFGLMLKYFELEARFPRREDIPRAAVEFMAGQVKVDAALFAFYDFTSRTAVNHRTQIREYHQFQEPTVGDEDKLVVWLASDIYPMEISRDRLRTALLTRCREERLEPPTPGRIEWLLSAAESMFERHFTETTLDRLNTESIEKLEELIVADEPGPDDKNDAAPGGAQKGESDEGEARSTVDRAGEQDGDTGSGTEDEDGKAEGAGGGRAFLQELKEDPGPLQLETDPGKEPDVHRGVPSGAARTWMFMPCLRCLPE
jgi:hypothetical protein